MILFESRADGHQTWSPTTLSEIGRNEAFLRDAIAECPDLLGLDGMESFVGGIGPAVSMSERRLTATDGASARPDVMLLTQRGELYLIEVKLSSNDDLRRRRAIAQTLDYAAILARADESHLA